MARIYDALADYMEVSDMLDDPELDKEMVRDTLSAYLADIEQAGNNIAAVVINRKADVAALKAEVKRLQDNIRTIESGTEYLEKMLFDAMQTAGIKKIESDPRFKIRIQKNGGLAPLVVTGDIPERFLIPQDPVPDNKAIRDYLKLDENCEWAHLGERGESLRIG